MKEVAPNIFMVTQTIKNRFGKFSVNVFVIAGSDGLVFDSGYGTKKASAHLGRQIRKIEELMKARGEECKITRVLPSHGHWDHFSGLENLRDSLGLKVLVTSRMIKSIGSKRSYRRSFRGETKIADVPVSRFKKSLYRFWHVVLDELYLRSFQVKFVKGPVKIIEENTRLTVGGETWEVIYLPGHCDDHIVLYSSKRGVVLAGDNLLRTVTTWLGPPRSDLEDYLESLRYLRGLPNLNLIFSAHGSVIKDPYKRLDEAIAHREKRTEDVFLIIKNGREKGVSFDELLKSFYPSTGFFARYIARGWILVTIDHLVKKGAVESYVAGGKRFFVVKPGEKI